MNRFFLSILPVIISVFQTYSQEVELATQKGHSSAISRVEFSDDAGYLISWGVNNEGIIWNLNLRKILTRFKIPENVDVAGLKFAKSNRIIKVQSDSITYFFNIAENRLTQAPSDKDTLYRRKDVFVDPDGKHRTFIEKGTIKKEEKGKWLPNYWISVNYTHAAFYSFDVHKKNDLIIGVAENNAIYCNEYKSGKNIEILQGHNSSATDIRFSQDGKLFATAGKDRSVIIWDAENFKIKFRLYSNIYRKNTAVFSHDGNKILVGDELGKLYTIDFNAIFPTTKTRSEPHSINKIAKNNYLGEPRYFISNSNNSLEIKRNLNDEPEQLIKFREHELTRPKGLVLQELFGLYQEPIGEVYTSDFSKDNNAVLFTGKTDLPNITLSKLNRNKTEHFYAYKEQRNWVDAEFLNDQDFVSLLENSGTLYFWTSDQSGYSFRRDSLPFKIQQFTVLDSNQLWVNSYDNGQYTYQVDSHVFEKVSNTEANNLFHMKGYIVLSDADHQIQFINPDSSRTEAVFKGHTERITGVDFHPTKDIFISASDDGTVKLWDYKKRNLIASIIPFHDNEVMIITADNYYLISKGALDEIGFRYEGQFFYPDQFDLKYNRPDLVLKKLGYTNEELIKAYHRAYKKRLKKLNFTEEALSGDFHLPELEITNKSEIPIETDSKEITLDLLFEDDQDKLESYKVWINDVAVLGSSGKSVRAKDTSRLQASVPLKLGRGDNKIEVSVLNQSGAESYKEVLNVKCTRGKEKPDAYIISIGISRYQDERYNLAYATKDAQDIQRLFDGSEYFGNVHTKSITDEDVVLESLDEIAAFLDQADVDDFVMVFIAGHGVLDENFDYYFASYDMDFTNPSGRGIPYKRIEELVDGIKALKKLLILDTCHSGELDKDEIEARQKDNDDLPEDGKFRNAGMDVAFREDPLGFENINFLMKQVFLDLRRGTGATVISSSGGTELAFESPKYENGLFTYSLIDALKSQKADVNKDDEITVSELQSYLIEEVKKLSNGKQVPTSRIHNKEMDYRVW